MPQRGNVIQTKAGKSVSLPWVWMVRKSSYPERGCGVWPVEGWTQLNWGRCGLEGPWSQGGAKRATAGLNAGTPLALQRMAHGSWLIVSSPFVNQATCEIYWTPPQGHQGKIIPRSPIRVIL